METFLEPPLLDLVDAPDAFLQGTWKMIQWACANVHQVSPGMYNTEWARRIKGCHTWTRDDGSRTIILESDSMVVGSSSSTTIWFTHAEVDIYAHAIMIRKRPTGLWKRWLFASGASKDEMTETIRVNCCRITRDNFFSPTNVACMLRLRRCLTNTL
jgi:hypothetical protein